MNAPGKSRTIGWPQTTVALVLTLGLFAGCRHRPPPTAAQEEADFIQNLAHSGQVPDVLSALLEPKAKELWDATFDQGRENLRKYHRRITDLRSLSPINCYKAGCMIHLQFADRAAANIFEEDLLLGPASPLHEWPGRIYRGPFIDGENATIEATWALLIDPRRQRELAAVTTTRRAATVPDQPTLRHAISDLQPGEQR